MLIQGEPFDKSVGQPNACSWETGFTMIYGSSQNPFPSASVGFRCPYIIAKPFPKRKHWLLGPIYRCKTLSKAQVLAFGIHTLSQNPLPSARLAFRAHISSQNPFPSTSVGFWDPYIGPKPFPKRKCWVAQQIWNSRQHVYPQIPELSLEMASVHPRQQLLPFAFGEPRRLSKGQP